MAQISDFDDQFDSVADYVEDLGHHVSERGVENIITGTVNETEYSFRGHRCEAEDGRYLVLGHPDLRYMSILYFLSVTQNIAEDLDDETANEILDEEDKDINEDQPRLRAAELLINDIPRGKMDSLETYIYMFISNGPQEVLFQYNDEESFSSFTVETQFFPFEDSFTIRELYESVRTAISAGRRGTWLLPRSLHTVRTEDEGEIELHIDFSW